ncbi:MAG: glycosyltransferase family 1 protein, partial [Sphingobacteriales bacterium]
MEVNNPGLIKKGNNAQEIVREINAEALRIGYDGKRAAKNLTGLGNYSRWLIEQLSREFPGNSYFVYTPKVKRAARIDQFFNLKNVFLKLPVVRSFLWRNIGILKDLNRDRIKLYHGLSHELPSIIHHTNIRSVVTIHDLIFLRYPQHYKFFDRLIYKIKSRKACKNADKIIAISERTKADIIEFYSVPEDKIQVIYQSCDDSFKKPENEERKNQIRTKYKLPEKYILYVGTIESRKNLVALVSALSNVDKAYKLVVIGSKKNYFKKVNRIIQENDLTNRVMIFERMDFSDLPG